MVDSAQQIVDVVDVPIAQTIPAAQPGDTDSPKIVPIRVTADPRREYVVGGTPFWTGTPLRVLPWTIDDLTVRFGPELYERMRFDDAVNAASGTVKTLVLADGWDIVPAIADQRDPNYAKALKAHALVARQIAALDPAIDETLYDLLDAVDFGHKIAELVWDYVAKGADHPDAGNMILLAIKPKARQATAMVVDVFLNIVGILALRNGAAPLAVDPLTVQGYGSTLASGTGAQPTQEAQSNLLPREKFCILTYAMKDADPRGTSALRAVYRPWWKKVQADPEHMKWMALFAMPSILSTTGPNAQPYPVYDANGQPVLDSAGRQVFLPPEKAMADALAEFKNATSASFPHGSAFVLVEAKGDGTAFLKTFDHLDNAIARAYLYQTLATGEGQHDSRAAAQVHQDILGKRIRRIKNLVAFTARRDIFTPIVRYNLGADYVPFAPSLSLGETDEEDKATRMTSIAALKREGMIFPSQYAAIHAENGLPPADPDEIAKASERYLEGVEGPTAITVAEQGPAVGSGDALLGDATTPAEAQPAKGTNA